mmetsp:Transcript_11992/g.51464  ORF Transcript_11992/g.51464 Transcript_11992/m.51464 type:complete len:217 (+) Transcript_11992:1548-2198(+)
MPSCRARNDEWWRRRIPPTRRPIRTRTRACSPRRRSPGRRAAARTRSRWTTPNSGRSSCPRRRRRRNCGKKRRLLKKRNGSRRRKKRTRAGPDAAPSSRNTSSSGRGPNARASWTSSARSGSDSGALCTPLPSSTTTRPPRTSRRFVDATPSRRPARSRWTRALSFWMRRALNRKRTSSRLPPTRAARSPWMPCSRRHCSPSTSFSVRTKTSPASS